MGDILDGDNDWVHFVNYYQRISICVISSKTHYLKKLQSIYIIQQNQVEIIPNNFKLFRYNIEIILHLIVNHNKSLPTRLNNPDVTNKSGYGFRMTTTSTL
jgi:hypothetical protein